jgi:hypothetical protein
MIVIGGTGGKVIALDRGTLNKLWKVDVGCNFAAVAFTADGKSILATFDDGVRYLDAATGATGDSIEEKGGRPTALRLEYVP